MDHARESYSDKWFRRYEEKRVAKNYLGQPLPSPRGLGRALSTTAVQSKNTHSMSLDVPLANPDINPVVQSSIELRKTLGLTQEAFARRLNISARTLRDWEQSRRQPSGPALTLLLWVVRDPKVIIDMDKAL